MSDHQHISQDDFDALLGDLLDAQLTKDQHTQLTNQLRDDSAACENFARHMALQAMLEAELNDLLPPLELEKLAPRVESQETAVGHATRDKHDRSDSARGACPTPRPKSLLDRASRHPKGPAVAIAATLLIAALVVMGLTPMKHWMAKSSKSDSDSPATSEFVAILNNAHQAKWLDGTRPRLKDPRLKVGRRLAIASGLIEVKYYTGARVVIEGPAEFVVGGNTVGNAVPGVPERHKQPKPAELARSKAGRGSRHSQDEGSEGHPSSFILHPSNSGYLALGKLVARVEGKKAQGFTIVTPSGRVQDHGTEFAIEVLHSGAEEYVVLSGEVDVIHGASDGRPGERIRLKKNQAAFVAARGGTIARREKVDARTISSFRRQLDTSLAVHPVAVDAQNAIGLNFVDGRRGRDGVLRSSASAGVVAQFNWNNTTANVEHDGFLAGDTTQIVGPVYGQVIDSHGLKTDVKVSWTGLTTWAIEKDVARLPHGKLMTCFLITESHRKPDATITFNEIPYASYDVYVYFCGLHGKSGNLGVVTLNGDTRRAVTSKLFDGSQFDEATGDSDAGHYARFANVGGPTCSINLHALPAQGKPTHMGILGVQIVEVEESMNDSSEQTNLEATHRDEPHHPKEQH